MGNMDSLLDDQALNTAAALSSTLTADNEIWGEGPFIEPVHANPSPTPSIFTRTSELQNQNAEFINTVTSLATNGTRGKPVGSRECADVPIAHWKELAHIVTEVFQNIESGDTCPSAASDLFQPNSLGYTNLHTHMFSSTEAFLQTLSAFELSNSSSPMSEARCLNHLDDPEILLVLSCFLKLLLGYDKIFEFWVDVLHGSPDRPMRCALWKETLFRLLPPISIGRFFAPMCCVAQLRLVLDVSGKMYQKLSRGLQEVGGAIGGRDRSSAATKVTHISDTTVELVLGRDRLVKVKRDKVLELIEDKNVQRQVEVNMSSMPCDTSDATTWAS